MPSPDITFPSASPRWLLLHFHNYEVLAAYGQGSRSPRDLLRETALLTRYALVVADGRLAIMPKFLWEAEYFAAYLRLIRPLVSSGLLGYAGTSADFGDDLLDKKRQYRDAPGLFPTYFDARLSREQLKTLEQLSWIPRLGPSATAAIEDAWRRELQPGGELSTLLTGLPDSKTRSHIEAQLADVPGRLDGRAFVLREVTGVLDFEPDGATKTRINWVINRAYLRLYLESLGAVALFDTPLGGLDFGLAAEDETRSAFISHARLASLLTMAGLRSAVERLPWGDLIALRHDAGFRVLIDDLRESATGSDYLGPSLLERRLRDPAVAGRLVGLGDRTRSLNDARDQVARLLEVLGPEAAPRESAGTRVSRIVLPSRRWFARRARRNKRDTAPASATQLQFPASRSRPRIGVLAITEDEFKAVVARLPKATDERRTRWYRCGDVASPSGVPVEVVAMCARSQGAIESAVCCRDMLADWDQDLDALCLVGIGGGLPTMDYTLGDVVLARSIQDLNVRAVVEGRPDAFSAVGSPVAPAVGTFLAHLPSFDEELAGWASEQSVGSVRPAVTDPKTYGPDEWQGAVRQSIAYHFGTGVRSEAIAIVAPMVSLGALVKSPTLADQVRMFARHAAAFEMEAAGVFHAAEAAGVPVVVVKGVSDIVGLERAPEWTPYAANTAAAYFIRLLESGLLVRALGR